MSSTPRRDQDVRYVGETNRRHVINTKERPSRIHGIKKKLLALSNDMEEPRWWHSTWCMDVVVICEDVCEMCVACGMCVGHVMRVS